MRSLDGLGQWLTAFLIAVFALPPVALFAGLASDRSFWSNFLPMAGFIIILSLLRDSLSRLARGLQFVAWVFMGAGAAALVALSRNEAFSLATAAVLGLALAFGDFLAEHLRAKRKAHHG